MKAISFDEMYEKYSESIFNHLLQKTKNIEVAEDLASEVWIKVSQHLSLYNPEKAQFNTWVFKIATNHFIDYVRKEKRQLKKAVSTVIIDEMEYSVISNIAGSSDIQRDIENVILKLISCIICKIKSITILRCSTN